MGVLIPLLVHSTNNNNTSGRLTLCTPAWLSRKSVYMFLVYSLRVNVMRIEYQLDYRVGVVQTKS